jgi:hypothetical protein
MKIEIELEEVERLKHRLHTTQEELKELKFKLKSLSEDELKKQAVRLSYRLFQDYMKATFERLGLGEWEGTLVINNNLEHWIGKEWWTSERVSFEIGAEVTTKIKRAFLRIGIITDTKDIKNSDDDIYKLT